MSKVLVALAEGFEEAEAITVVDVLRRGGVEVVTASVSAERDVRSQGGVVIRADALLSEAGDDAYDAIVLPGGGLGTQNLKKCEPLVRLLRRQKDEGRLLCAICAAPTVLVAAGVIPEGVHMTVYPTFVMELDRPSAGVPVVEDGQFVTGQAPGAAMLFSLVILKKLMGDKTAERVARGLVTDVLD